MIGSNHWKNKQFKNMLDVLISLIRFLASAETVKNLNRPIVAGVFYAFFLLRSKGRESAQEGSLFLRG